MRSILIAAIGFSVAVTAAAQIALNPEPASCTAPIPAVQTCLDGTIGSGAPEPFSSLSAAEVQAIVNAAASALNVNTATIAVVDRTGRALAVFRQPNANPANDDLALAVARTPAFFSNSQAPLSSRTVRFISGVHFPSGLLNTGGAALYGIEQSQRGCDLNVQWNEGKCVARARSLSAYVNNDKLCNSTDTSGCSQGLVTGKLQPDDGPYPQTVFNRNIEAGGIPLYRVLNTSNLEDGRFDTGKLVGAIGVYGLDGPPELEEYAAVTGAFGALNGGVGAIAPIPFYPLPFPGNVFIEGIRLPFLGKEQRLRFNEDGLPIGLVPPEGTSAGTTAGAFIYGPAIGGCAPNGYLVGPKAGQRLTQQEVDAVVQRSIAFSKRTRAAVRLPIGSFARMIITVADLDGSILAHYRMEDALFDAVDVVPAKARNAVYFNVNSASQRADLPGLPDGFFVTGRTLGFLAQPLYPSGIDGEQFEPVGPGPWYESLYLPNVDNLCREGSAAPTPNQNGVVFFGGNTALVKNGEIVGGLGVSGDGIEQDDYVTFFGAGDLLPPRNRWADRLFIEDVRLPMFKFPRRPEGVTECGGKPCQ